MTEDLPEHRAELISRVDLFRGVDRVALAKLVASFDAIKLTDGEAACVQGETGDSLYIVSSGTLGIFVTTGGGSTARVRSLYPGEYFGEIALLTAEKRSATVRAEGPCEVLKLEKKKFHDLTKKEPMVALALAGTLGQRLRGTTATLAEREHLIGWRISESLARMSPALREQIYVAVLFASLDERVLNAACGDAGEVRAELAALGAWDGPSAAFVRGHLKERLAAELGPERTRLVSHESSTSLEQRGLFAEALALVAASGDRATLGALLTRVIGAQREREANMETLDGSRSRAELEASAQTLDGARSRAELESSSRKIDAIAQTLHGENEASSRKIDASAQTLHGENDASSRKIDASAQTLHGENDASSRKIDASARTLPGENDTSMRAEQRANSEASSQTLHRENDASARTLDGPRRRSASRARSRVSSQAEIEAERAAFEAQVAQYLELLGDEELVAHPELAEARTRARATRGGSSARLLGGAHAATRGELAEQMRQKTNAKRPLLPLFAIANALLCIAAATFFRATPQAAFVLLLVAAIGLWITEAVPELAVALGMLAGWILLGITTVAKAFAGFGSPQWMFAVAILSIAASISHSGLLFRLGLFMARRMPRGLVPQSIILLLTGVVLTPLLPSSTARAALTMPLAVSVVDAARYEDRGSAAALLGQAAWLGANPLLFMFLNGSTSTILAWGLLPEASRARFGWWHWFVAALPLGMLVAIGSLTAFFFVLRPGPSPELSQKRLGLQLAILGKASVREKALLVILGATVISWALAPVYGVDTNVVALVSAMASVVAARLDRKALGELDWPFLTSFGVMLVFSEITTKLGIDKIASEHIGALTTEFHVSGFVAVMAIAVINLIVRTILPPNQSILILSVALLPLAPSLALDPWVIVMTLLATSQTWFFPAQNFAYMVADAAGEGRLFSQAQSRRICFVYVVITLLALALCVPLWRLLGIA